MPSAGDIPPGRGARSPDAGIMGRYTARSQPGRGANAACGCGESVRESGSLMAGQGMRPTQGKRAGEQARPLISFGPFGSDYQEYITPSVTPWSEAGVLALLEPTPETEVEGARAPASANAERRVIGVREVKLQARVVTHCGCTRDAGPCHGPTDGDSFADPRSRA